MGCSTPYPRNADFTLSIKPAPYGFYNFRFNYSRKQNRYNNHSKKAKPRFCLFSPYLPNGFRGKSEFARFYNMRAPKNRAKRENPAARLMPNGGLSLTHGKSDRLSHNFVNFA